MNIQEWDQGFLIHLPSAKIFLGKKNSQVEILQNLFPQYKFSRVHQVHGKKVQFKNESNWPESPEADAQWSELTSTALCISTADCIPLFIYDPVHHRLAAVHAGWRGVAQKIVAETFEILFKKGSKPEELYVVIGPHIQKSSFEVDEKVKNELLQSVQSFNEDWVHSTIEGKKFLVDLHQLVKAQLHEVGVQPEQLSSLFLDTKNDLRFHSYRRDKEKSGRQISFIVQD